MKTLSATARRFVERALTDQGATAFLSEWHAWSASGSEEIPHRIAQIALHALSGQSLALEARLDSTDISSAEAARIESDIGYIADVEAFLTESLRELTGQIG